MSASRSTVDDAEIARFSAMAAEWWDPTGKFRPLHKFNPVRLTYLKASLARQFGRDANAPDALSGLDVLDIGCGGGLLSEPLTRLGAKVTGVDASATNIGVARSHAEVMGLAIDYRADTAEALVEAGEHYDVVLAMEIVEHVADLDLFVGACAGLVKPGGLLVMATLNRTAKSFALAILGAEYVLRWLPVGTHDWSRFVKPEELSAAIEAHGLKIRDETGVTFNPLADRWSLAPGDMSVNYMLLAERPGAAG
ncbi:MAG: bifunctional 2-polyprenyl-6-hydroxyphenol methylase/3-demethylubiquinol 3-O-methyltransferase UbiG [Ancalomicrobiaceae bacterium]|nr:bifunctional 2-polyprenyl-6-hydroxyphenol methylase/3-demethylubiquinol 3-O-methyltransferase UbiG [Ancalomicrobiaceae bacterium]